MKRKADAASSDSLAQTKSPDGIFSRVGQMCNRGNGKGGGIAAVGLSAETLGVNSSILTQITVGHRLSGLSVSEPLSSANFIHPLFDIDHAIAHAALEDHKELSRLD